MENQNHNTVWKSALTFLMCFVLCASLILILWMVSVRLALNLGGPFNKAQNAVFVYGALIGLCAVLPMSTFLYLVVKRFFIK